MDEVQVVEAVAQATTNETSGAIAPVESVRMNPGTIHRARREERPDPSWVRGHCPECGDDLVSNMYYIGGRGYLIRWECWSSLRENPACSFYKVL